MKRSCQITATLLALILVISFMVVPLHADAQSFRDVPTSAWYYGYVENLAEKKIVGGFPDGTFKPDAPVQRQHVAKMVVKAAGLPYKGKKASFPDVPPSNEMSPFIAALQEKEIIGGYKDGTFGPRKSVTRAEVSVMIAKAFGIKTYGKTTSMKDLKGHWAEGLVKILISNGVVKGYADGSFKPNNPVTRAELSKMLTLTMAVTAVQKAEETRRDPDIDKAQDLINSLPYGQDLETRGVLQDRLNVLRPPKPFEEREPNDTLKLADPVHLNKYGYTYINGITNRMYDMDYFRIQVEKKGTLVVSGTWLESYLQGSPVRYLAVRLVDREDKILTTASFQPASSSGPASVTMTYEVNPGTYYLLVHVSSDAAYNLSGMSYQLSVEIH